MSQQTYPKHMDILNYYREFYEKQSKHHPKHTLLLTLEDLFLDSTNVNMNTMTALWTFAHAGYKIITLAKPEKTLRTSLQTAYDALHTPFGVDTSAYKHIIWSYFNNIQKRAHPKRPKSYMPFHRIDGWHAMQKHLRNIQTYTQQLPSFLEKPI